MVVFVEEENRENKDGGEDDDDVVVNENAKTKEKKKENRDVFVRNLPHTTTDEALETPFRKLGSFDKRGWRGRKGRTCTEGSGTCRFR